MILLITPSQRACECAAAIETALAQPVQAVRSFQDAAARLRTHAYAAVVIDECLLDADPDQASLVLTHLQTAIPVYVNGAITGVARVVDRVESAFQQRRYEEAAARESAVTRLKAELREPLTGILLNCGLVLDTPNCPAGVQEKIRNIHDLAQQLSLKLQLEEDSMHSAR